MSLTLGTGPLASAPGGAFNFDLAGASPKHRIFFADYPLRLRAVAGDRTVVDTTRAKLLYETNIMPVVYAPLEDFDASLLERTDHSTHCPFKGDASYWTVRAGDVVLENAVWAYEDPLPRRRGWRATPRCTGSSRAPGTSRRSRCRSATCATCSTASTCTRARARRRCGSATA